jgi:hypothetical protein
MVCEPRIEPDASQETEFRCVFHFICVLQAPPMPSLVIIIISAEKVCIMKRLVM